MQLVEQQKFEGEDWVQRIIKQKGLIIEQHRTKLETLRVQMEVRTVASIESIIEEEGRTHEIELKHRDDERRTEASHVEA